MVNSKCCVLFCKTVGKRIKLITVASSFPIFEFDVHPEKRSLVRIEDNLQEKVEGISIRTVAVANQTRKIFTIKLFQRNSKVIII